MLHCVLIFCLCLSRKSILVQLRRLNQEKFIMKKLFHYLFLIFVATVSVVSHADTVETIKAQSGWTNQSGSTLYIDSVGNDGQITGHYINRAQGYGCQNIAYPVTGWVYGTAITFTTNWKSTTESCNSITAWTGFLYQGQIQTLWQLVVNGSSNTNQIAQGADTFTWQPQKNLKSLKIEE